jgi:hypothetical protein
MVVKSKGRTNPNKSRSEKCRDRDVKTEGTFINISTLKS